MGEVASRRSFLPGSPGIYVAIEKIISFDNKYVYLPGEKISIGEQYRSALPLAVTILANEPSRKDVFSELEIQTL